MSQWFGKKCKYLVAQWEETELTGGPNYKEAEPCLKYCKHPKNLRDCEGNCLPEDCPLGFSLESFTKDFELTDPLPGTQFSLWRDNIHKSLIRSNGQCPCVSDPQLQGVDTLCPCKEYRQTLYCKCSLYASSKLE